jgi:hypothetical protein
MVRPYDTSRWRLGVGPGDMYSLTAGVSTQRPCTIMRITCGMVGGKGGDLLEPWLLVTAGRPITCV